MTKKDTTKHDDASNAIRVEDIKDAASDAADENNIEDSAQKIEGLELRIEEAEHNYKRALADYQNLQKRSFDERQEWIRSSNKDLLLRILSVLDTLILAHNHVQDKNLEISIKHFLDILKSEGVTRIETNGCDFDPAVMEAIATAEGEEGKVIAEVRAGFMLHDRLLRAAQVTVGASSN